MTSSRIIQLKSPYSFTESVRRLLAAFTEKSIKVFAIIDQQAEARNVGLSMPPTTLIVFGNPKTGTPLMLSNPQIGVDLPLRVLVCELEADETTIMFTSVSELMQRHSVSPELAANIVPAERLIQGIFGYGT